MALVPTILNSTGELDPIAEALCRALNSAIDRLEPLVALNVDVCVSHGPEHCNPELGIGGGAFHKNLLNIFLDAKNPRLLDSLRDELVYVLGHEIHHCARMDAGIDDETLLGAIVREGLACCFEAELRQGEPPSFLPISVRNEWRGLYQSMQKDLMKTDFCFDAYFLGGDQSRFPKYAGYAVGYGLVGEYLSLRSIGALDAVAIPAESFLG